MATCTAAESGAKMTHNSSPDEGTASVLSTFKIYLNPSTGFIQIEFDAPTDDLYTFHLCNSLGVSVFKSQFANERGIIQLPQSIPSGLYVAAISVGEVPVKKTVLILNR